MDTEYDVFISYNHDDETWVRDWLLPHLENHGLRVCIDFREFDVGVPLLENVERAVDRSEKTLLVLTPDWLDSEWTAFESLLVQTEDPAAYHRKLVPLLLERCDLPRRLGVLTYANFTDEERWEFELERVIAAMETERTAQESAADAPSSGRPAEARAYTRSYQIALTHLLSLQYPWGEWSDRRTSLESEMAERHQMRGVEGPKPNVARTLYALEALEALGDAFESHRQRAMDWLESGISDGWYREWALGGTPESETVIPNLVLRRDTRHSAESITTLVKWDERRDPLAALVANVAASSLDSGFWPDTPGASQPRLLATVYAVEGLGRVSTGGFRLPPEDLLDGPAARTVTSAFRRGLVALEDDCEAGNGLLGSLVGDPTPYLTGIALFRLAPLAPRHDGVERLAEKLVDGLLTARDDDGWRNTAVPDALQDRTVRRTTLRVAAGLAEARNAGVWSTSGPWRELLDLVSGYATGQEVLELDSPDHACLMIALAADRRDLFAEIEVETARQRADDIREEYVEHWRSNFETYHSRLEQGRAYDVDGYEELAASLEAKIARL